MKKFYAKKFKAYKNLKQYSLLALLLMAFSFYSYGQVIKPFTPRVSEATGQSVYSVKGDFTILGNTSLTPYNASNDDNSNMEYVDIDGNPNTLNSSAATLQLTDDNGDITDCSNILYAGLYWSGRPGPDQSFEASNGTLTKTLNKSVVSISGPTSTSYSTITATPNNIFYPESVYANMFIAYADVTDYVKQNGPGNYTIADIALLEGKEEANVKTGYYGGWSMVVIYENSNMKMRNISVFDGYSYKTSSNDPDYVNTNELDIDISALNTSQDDVKAQIGIMAAEGDLNLQFDYFKIKKSGASSYTSLINPSNTTGLNFFNSSINVGSAPRNPYFVDNTGMGFSKFDIPDNYIVNSSTLQSELEFQYSAIQDKYVIYNLTLAFEAPAPDIEAEVAITNINGTPNTSETTTVEPGQNITYKVDVKNFGTEASTNSMLSIPLPYNTTYQSLNYNSYAPYSSVNAPVYNAATHTIDWNLGNLPVTTSTDNLLASLTFTVTTTTDCTLLVVECANLISLNGDISGTGADSGNTFDKSLITGYDDTVGCIGTPIPAPIFTTIDAISYVNANCADVPVVKNFYYCASSSTTIPVTDISSTYPIGTRFYNEYPVTSSSVEYTTTFPGTTGATTYYAVPPGTDSCYFEFVININSVTSVPTVSPEPIDYCLNETAVPLTATPSDPALTLYYYADNNPSTAPQTSITPNTDIAGTFTYYVAEGPSADCISENRVPITVIVNDLLEVTSNITDSTCTPGNDGSIDITVTGGSGNYTYLWSTGETTQDISGLTPDTYVVTITDETTGCDTVTAFTIATDINSFPTITAPAAYVLEGCDISVITSLPVSTTPVSITLDQLQSAEAGGGTATGFSSISYMDVVLGTCPTVVTRTFTATNACNNATTATQTITIEDTEAPIVPVAPADITIECSDPLPPMVDLTATDNCASTPTIIATGVDTTDNSDPCNVIVTRTWTFTDDCGNTSDVSQIITIKDTTNPVIDSANYFPITIYCNGEEKNSEFDAWLAINGGLTATDNCTSENDIVWTNNFVETDITPCNSDFQPVTFTATDACGNQSTFIGEFKFTDETGPAIIDQPMDATFECSDEDAIQNWLTTNGGALAIDECSETVTWSNNFTTVSGECGNTGSATVIFSASDTCGNITNSTAVLTLVDTTAPVAPAAPADITVQCIDDVPAAANLTATDNCSSTVTVTTNDSTDNTNPCDIIITRTWIFTDECGNASQTSQTINVIDTTAPTAPSAPADVTIECTTDVPAMIDLTAVDNCGELITVTGEDTTNDADLCNVIITRTWTFEDNCGNISTTTQLINVKDETAPVAPADLADITVSCITDVPAPTELTAVDNCNGDITAMAVDSELPADSCNSSIIRTWTFADACGNTSTTSQTINIVDDIAPTFTTDPIDILYVCNGEERNNTIDAWVSINAGAEAEDNCSNVTWTNNYDPNSVVCNGATTVIFTATDDCGNSVSKSATYTIEDTTGPTITVESQDLSLDCGGTNSPELQDWLNTNGGAMAQDVCSETTWTNNYDPNATINGTVTVTFTASDACGNTSTTSADIIITDTTAPIPPTAPADVTVECSDIPAMIDLTATDNCEGEITVAGVDSVNDTDPCNIIITRTWTFTDSSNNTSSTSQIITAIDTMAPIVPTIPADVTIECSDPLPPMVDLTATDDCGADVTATPVDVIDDSNPCNVIVTRTWVFEDACGNVSSGSQIITLIDETGPVITQEAIDIVYECNGEERNTTIDAWVSINAGAEAEDSCSDITWTNNYDPNYESCNEAVEVTFTATDACGNSTSTSATYTIKDEAGPTMETEASDINIECNENADTAITDWITSNGGAMAFDYCSDVTWSNNFDPSSLVMGACGPENAVTVIFTATDYCGNSTETSASITITDETAPTVPTNVPADVTVECYDDIPAMIDLTATDDCSGTITVSGVDNEDNSDPTNVVITRTWTFTDACGNTSEVSQTITVIDDTAPVVDTPPTDLTVECIDDVPAMEPLTATDNCAGTITSNGTETINDTDACNIIITRTWVFTDNSGNSTETTQIITVKDETAPVVDSTPADMTIDCGATVPAMEPLTATDNCAGTITSNGIETVNDSDPLITIITRTWSFTDACGNTTEVSQTITVLVDDTAPVVDTPPTDLTVECIDDVPAMEPLTATDNCAGTITSNGTETINDTDACNIIITRTWVFTDTSGNSTETTQIITVKDETAPVVDTPPTDMNVQCEGDVPALEPLTATDNCAGVITSNGTETINDSNPLITVITRTWSFADACGNTTEVSQTITVSDTTAPIVNDAPTDITYACIDEVPELAPLTATDNCVGEITDNGTQTIDDADSCNVTITRTWIFTDASENTTEVTQVITVKDDVAPTAPTTPEDVTVECLDDIPAMIDLTATDNCGAEITSTGVDTVNEIDSCSRIITRTWSFTDACGNNTTISQIITVADVTPPTLVNNLDTNITVNCSAIPEKPELEFTDNCSTILDIVYTEDNTSTGAAYENYQVIREWTVTDSCGNTSEFTQTITVNVQQEPVQETDTKCTEGGDINLDSYLADPSTDGTWVVDSGDATLNGSIFDPSDVEVGTYVFTFTEASGCENQTIVTININEDCVEPTCDPIISTTVTPNGDQWNEYFTVTGLDRCGFVVNVEIYNRWGSLVFKADNYSNNWNGKNDKGTFGNADQLPTGTYYYIVTLKNSGLKPLTGPIYLGTK